MNNRRRAIEAAQIHLLAARDLVKVAGKAPKALAKIRAAITSTQSAQEEANK